MLPSDDPAAVQLRLIHELTTVLHEARIPHWLFGGWGVDFLVGEITRPHHDIDLIVWLRDAPAFRDLLAWHGYNELSSPSGPELDARFCKQSQLLEVMFIHEREEGGTYWSHWRLPSGSLAARHGRVGDILCPIVSPQTLLDCKEACLLQENEPSEREKHAQDIARLRPL
jgi:aminoglycoside-2''-adenylyltransferase